MKSEKRELFRIAVLSVLEANNTRFGLPASAIGHLLGPFGFRGEDLDEIKPELAYLEDKGFVEQVLKGISPENRAWRITAAGRDFVAVQG